LSAYNPVTFDRALLSILALTLVVTPLIASAFSTPSTSKAAALASHDQGAEPAAYADPVLAACANEQICTEMFVPLGGIDQWISIAGENRRNPLLLVVHGGPGDVQWPEAARYKPWEKNFTVVQWDQRGAGHTYGLYGAQTPNVDLRQIAADGVQLARYLCRTFGRKKIIVLGHSWGSDVAVTMVQMQPALFAAYVGTGQVTSWNATVDTQFDVIRANARLRHDRTELKALAAIGRLDPANAKQYFELLKYLPTVRAPSDQVWLNSQRAGLPALRARDPKSTRDLLNGMAFSGLHLIADELRQNLPETANRIDTAFFVIQGQQDVITPTKLAVAYFNHVRAPVKKLIVIPDAGHFAFMTAPRAFLRALVRQVRPVAIARGA